MHPSAGDIVEQTALERFRAAGYTVVHRPPPSGPQRWWCKAGQANIEQPGLLGDVRSTRPGDPWPEALCNW